ncbi:glycoside hydrolase superfamily [Mycena maculata]|uniref:Glycoside hydrolase superfamily n=1 Tax=Mycena maculata TaxID=230809 RepID=A0AAD7IFT9_9AGAR|nr:glycoside hydrolase superfamily [Mycena maculata]
MNIVPVDPFPPFDPQAATIYRYRQQYGVNCGSWFVLEKWMTPSMFQNASGHKLSEIDIASGSNSTNCARKGLEEHWSTFISESDFDYLSGIGINTVRLPIGYWSLGPEYCEGTPFSPYADVYSNSWAYVVRAINLAAKYGIGVIVDLHGAVGSQNGQPHSGISDRHVGLFDSPANVKKTLAVLVSLVQKLCLVTNIVGIQILNEPVNVPGLSDFYTRAISTMRQVSDCAKGFPLYIHDGFDLERFSDYVSARSDFVVQDHHSYFVFTTQDDSESASNHTNDIETSIAQSLAIASARGNLIVGEWSGALTPQSLSNEPDQDAARRNFSTAQMDVYSTTTAGWIFWAYKTEDCGNDPDWCFTVAVGHTLPPTFFRYMNGCQSSRSVESRDLNPSMPSFRHRLAAIHHRRSGDNVTAEEQSSHKGYSDGVFAAQLFCKYGGSMLGLDGQYISDRIVALGPTVIQTGTEPSYSAAFYRGLSDGEESMS